MRASAWNYLSNGRRTAAAMSAKTLRDTRPLADPHTAAELALRMEAAWEAVYKRQQARPDDYNNWRI